MYILRKKRPVSIENLILHQDNAPAHRARDTQLNIQIHLGAEVLSHPPYLPDLSPCDFALFPRLKKELRGRRFDNLDELRGASNHSARNGMRVH
jgi:histone-lysine N-methyltransferase SETMAR